MSHAIR